MSQLIKPVGYEALLDMTFSRISLLSFAYVVLLHLSLY